MISELTIEGFRGFRACTLAGLTRVNLLVGPNNAGKTSALEAVELLQGDADLAAVAGILARRGEVLATPSPQGGPLPDVRGLFHGREAAPGAVFRLAAGDAEVVGRLVVGPDEVAVTAQAEGDGWLPEDAREARLSVALARTPVTPPRPRHAADAGPRARYLGAAPERLSRLGAMWDRVVLTEREAAVTDALRLIEPRIRRLAFLGGRERLAQVFVQLEGSGARVPLGAMGEGIRRLLAFALVLADAPRGGVLLIDELDAGLHHAVLVPLWRMLIEAARQSGLQVFATTHSLDALMALSRATVEDPALGAEVSVHRFVAGAAATVRFDATELRVAIDAELEVR